jgi:hypothetical protein
VHSFFFAEPFCPVFFVLGGDRDCARWVFTLSEDFLRGDRDRLMELLEKENRGNEKKRTPPNLLETYDRLSRDRERRRRSRERDLLRRSFRSRERLLRRGLRSRFRSRSREESLLGESLK